MPNLAFDCKLNSNERIHHRSFGIVDLHLHSDSAFNATQALQ